MTPTQLRAKNASIHKAYVESKTGGVSVKNPRTPQTGKQAVKMAKRRRKIEAARRREEDKLNTEQGVISEIKIDAPVNTVCCITCRKNIKSASLLLRHFNKKHSKAKSVVPSIQQEIQAIHKVAVESVLTEIKKKKSNADLKAALREQLADSPDDSRPYYNVEAYRIAILSMSVSDAYKLAKDADRASAFIASQNAPVMPLEAPVSVSKATIAETPVKAAESVLEGFTGTYKADVVESATFTERTIKARANQAGFTDRVRDNFKGRCAVTGSSQGVQACHLEPVATGNNNTSNGVLLLATLHVLMDHGFMAIHPERLTVHFSPACDYFAKDMLEGKALSPHAIPLNKAGLVKIWESFISIC